MTLEQLEEAALRFAFWRFGGNRKLIGEALGMPKTTLFAKLEKYGLRKRRIYLRGRTR